jgi:RNA polymerase sigma-70 factor (ECF subfamily)
MDKNQLDFLHQEKIFKQRTGKEFTTLYKKYYPKLIFYINKICKDRKIAEDISTDSFIMALEKINLYDKNKAQFSTWLFTIARNLTYQDLKRESKTTSIDENYDTQGTTMKNFLKAEVSDSIDKEINFKIISQKAKVLSDNIYKLREPYRTVIQMRELDKLSYQAISNTLDRNLSTIKSQIRNGRQLLIDISKEELSNIDKKYK